MAFLNDHYLKLAGGYLFPEIARRVAAFVAENPAAGARLVRCGIGDVTEPLPASVREAMKAAIDEMGWRETFRGYGDPQGYLFLREAIARHDFAAIGVSIAVYPVYVDTNVMAGHTGAARPDGSYPGLVYLPCTAANGFVPEIPDEKLDVVYLCYPNNPTGGMITRPRLEAWVEYALRHGTLILYDVAYRAFIRDRQLPRSIYEIEGARRCAIEFHSFSKNAGFTGIRCGFTVCPQDVAGTTRDGRSVPLHGLWARRWSTKSNSVSYPVQRGAEAVYSPAGQREVAALVSHYMGNADRMRRGCLEQGWSVYGGENAPYLWVACPSGVDSWTMFDRMLREANVVITPGVGFGRCGEGYIRISAFNSRQNVEEVVRRMEAISPCLAR
jgi:LL-diaminopimelate aminotransferase